MAKKNKKIKKNRIHLKKQARWTIAKLSDGAVETIFLNTDLRYAYLSSSTVREVASFGGDISKFVTPDVAKLVYEKYNLK